MAGWVKLHRELISKPIWQCSKPEQKVILITILLLANHAEKDWVFEGKKYKCLPGQFVTSLKSLSEKSGTSIQSVRTALEKFEKIYQFLTNKSTNKNRLISVINWELYQSNEEEPTSKSTSNQQATNKQLTTNKNDKNIKNEKKDPSCADGNCSLIILEYQKHLGDHNIKRQQEVLDYLEKGLDADVIVECIRDSVIGEQPCKYVFGILDRCVQEKVFTVARYIDRKKEHEKIRKQQSQKNNQNQSHNNFEQRDYSDSDFEKYYEKVT